MESLACQECNKLYDPGKWATEGECQSKLAGFCSPSCAIQAGFMVGGMVKPLKFPTRSIGINIAKHAMPLEPPIDIQEQLRKYVLTQPQTDFDTDQNPWRTGSYPYLVYARLHSLDYGLVLTYADILRDGDTTSTFWRRKAYAVFNNSANHRRAIDIAKIFNGVLEDIALSAEINRVREMRAKAADDERIRRDDALEITPLNITKNWVQKLIAAIFVVLGAVWIGYGIAAAIRPYIHNH